MTYNLRQLAICDPESLNNTFDSTTLIGLGGIGSSVMLALSKMGLDNITAYDPDTLEDHNFGNQFLPLWDGMFSESLIGKPKANAMGILLNGMMHAEANWRLVPQRFSGTGNNQRYGTLTIITVDSMAVRKEIWDDMRNNDGECLYYIDARMGAQTIRIYTVNMLDEDNIAYYERSLYSDEQAVQEPCTARGIIYTSLFAGAHVAHLVKQLAVGPQGAPWMLAHQIEHNMVLCSTERVKALDF